MHKRGSYGSGRLLKPSLPTTWCDGHRGLSEVYISRKDPVISCLHPVTPLLLPSPANTILTMTFYILQEKTQKKSDYIILLSHRFLTKMTQVYQIIPP